MISQFPPVRQRPLLFLPLLVALAVSGGCAVIKPDPNPAPAAADSDPESSVGVAITDQAMLKAA